MTRQEQVEEMAKTMCDTSPLEACYHLCLTDVVPCEAKKRAVLLFEKGYRKASDVIDEFVERLKELLNKHEYRSQTDGVPFYQMNAESFCDELNELAAKMRQEIEK